MRWTIWFVGALLAAPPTAPGPGRASGFHPPLEIESTPVASFGEYRPDHLHPGVDLSTGGRVGLPVRAVAAGEIYRLKVEWRGYGRALYLRHADHRVSVYAHLDRFEEETLGLESRVVSAKRESRLRYPGDIYLDPPVPVRRGQRIAYTGESGAGLPHLHFELRRDEMRPSDPAPALGRIAAVGSPRFEALVLLAAEPATLVQGERAAELQLAPDREGTYAPAAPAVVTGRFIPEARIVSEDRDGHRFGIRGLNVRVDGALVYRFHLEEFTFESYPQVGLLLDHARSRLAPPLFTYRLARIAGNELGRSGSGGESAWPAPSPGLHHLEVEALGAFGGRARARIPFRTVLPPALRWDTEPSPAPGKVRLALRTDSGSPAGLEGFTLAYALLGTQRPVACLDRTRTERQETCTFELPREGAGLAATLLYDRVAVARVARTFAAPDREVTATPPVLARPRDGFVDLELPSGEPLSGMPARIRLLGSEGTEILRLPLEDLGGGVPGFSIPLRSLESARQVDLEWEGNPHPIRRELPLAIGMGSPRGALRFQHCGIRLDAPEGALFAPAAVGCETPASPVTGASGPLLRGSPVRLLPEGLPLARKASLLFPIPPGIDSPERLGIYRLDAVRERWVFQGGERIAGGLTLPIGRFDTFAMMEDVTPPSILRIDPPLESGRIPSRPRFVVHVEEEASGLNFDGVHLSVDGIEVETEFDPDRGWAVAAVAQPLATGSHTIACWAVDRAGNRTESRSFTATVP